MVLRSLTISHELIKNSKNPPSLNHKLRWISSLKVVWKKDTKLDEAIERDKRYNLCARVVKEVLNEPGQAIPLRYLEKRRERLRLNFKAKSFVEMNPSLFEIYHDRIKPKSDPVQFVRPTPRLRAFLEEEERIYAENEPLIVAKLCKLLMMAKDKVISAEKLVHVKRDFGFPNDFLVRLVKKYPNYFRLTGLVEEGGGKSFLELVDWNPDFAKSVIEIRAQEETVRTGVRVRPNFDVKLPSGLFLRKEMREWTRDWLEQDYISPYEDVSRLDQASKEMEKRTVGVFHELLSLSLLKRVPVPILGKFCEEFRFSNAFSSVFTRHSGVFYLSLKGGIKTAVLRQAYKDEELVDRDPLLAIKDKFLRLLEEGWQERKDRLKMQREQVEKDREIAKKQQEPEERLSILLLALSSSSFTRGQTIVHIPPPRPLCASQYALANYACSRLPMNTVPLPSPIAPPPPPIFPPPDHDHDHDHDDDHDHDHDGDDHDHDHDGDDHDHHDDDDHHHNHHDHDHDHNNHGHDHDDDDHDHHHHNDNSHRRHHRRRHHHHHHHHRHREETYAQQECCKWVKQMDNECVCDLLVRLPPLLAKPAHNYTVFVDESCIVTFTCGGRLIR
ncbi:unnamed protein product [Brassica oleracea]